MLNIFVGIKRGPQWLLLIYYWSHWKGAASALHPIMVFDLKEIIWWADEYLVHLFFVIVCYCMFVCFVFVIICYWLLLFVIVGLWWADEYLVHLVSLLQWTGSMNYTRGTNTRKQCEEKYFSLDKNKQSQALPVFDLKPIWRKSWQKSGFSHKYPGSI